MNATRFYQAMDFIEQFGESLNFINRNDLGIGVQFLSEPFRRATEFEKHAAIEEVERAYAGQGVANERGFTGLAWSQQEMGLLRQKAGQVDGARDARCRHCRHLTCQMTIDSSMVGPSALLTVRRRRAPEVRAHGLPVYTVPVFQSPVVRRWTRDSSAHALQPHEVVVVRSRQIHDAHSKAHESRTLR